MPETAIARLTENEKECLRRRLLPQTAKEMAIDLGISPHAVEKRLKMARMKLGVSSSLAAARLLADSEGYQPLVPQRSDLSHNDRCPDKRQAMPARSRLAGSALQRGSIMLAVFFLIAVAQDVPPPSADALRMYDDKGQEVSARKVGMDEADAFDRIGFRMKDLDRSGFLDPHEVSTMEPRDGNRDRTLPAAPAAGGRDPAAERKWIAKLDGNRDGRVSEDEYVSYMLPWTLATGVPANWHPETTAVAK